MYKKHSKTNAAKPVTEKTLSPASPPAKIQPVNPEFETRLQETAAATEQGGKADGRGGARPGAGRPAGLSDELSRINKLPDIPHKGIVGAVELPFDVWAAMTKIKDLALKPEEAEDIALPITQLLAYYWPEAYDHIGWVWFCLTGSLTRITIPRLKLMAQIRAERQETAGTSVDAGKGGPVNPSDTGSPGPGGFPRMQIKK